MKSSSWQGNEIQGRIRTLAVNGAPILEYSNDRKTAVESASRDMVMAAVRASCEFSLLFSQQNHSVLSLTALYDAQKRLYRAKGAFQELKMSKSAKSKLDELLA